MLGFIIGFLVGELINLYVNLNVYLRGLIVLAGMYIGAGMYGKDERRKICENYINNHQPQQFHPALVKLLRDGKKATFTRAEEEEVINELKNAAKSSRPTDKIAAYFAWEILHHRYKSKIQITKNIVKNVSENPSPSLRQ